MHLHRLKILPLQRALPPKGFTLLEIVVVLVIVGIVFTFATLSMSGRLRLQRLKQTLQQVEVGVRHAEQEAVLYSAPRAIRFHQNSLETFKMEFKDQKLTWVPVGKPMKLSVGDFEVRSKIRLKGGFIPDLIAFPNGEITPFSLQFSDSFCLSGLRNGTLKRGCA